MEVPPISPSLPSIETPPEEKGRGKSLIDVYHGTMPDDDSLPPTPSLLAPPGLPGASTDGRGGRSGGP